MLGGKERYLSMSDETMQPAENTEAAPVATVAGNLRAKVFARKLAEESLYIPEWDITALIREMKGSQRAAVLNSSRNADGTRNLAQFYSDIVIASTFDPETRTPVFELTDRDTLNDGEAGGKAMERIATVATRLSGLTEDGMKAEVKN